MHHLILNRNDLLVGGIRPHYYCLPVVKREKHRLALLRAATSGDPRFFLGTDSAPHAQPAKEAACGCAGIFTAPVALACLAARLRGGRRAGPARGLRQPQRPGLLPARAERGAADAGAAGAAGRAPSRVETGAGPVVVFDPGFPLHWRVID